MKLLSLTTIILIASVIGFNVTATTVYKKVHADGSISYSDQQFTGAVATEVTLKNTSKLPSTVVKHQQNSSLKKPPQVSKPPEVSIVSPQPQQTIRANDGNLTIVVQSTPSLNDELKVQLYINNTPYQNPSQATVFNVKNVDRGEVRIKAELLNQFGNILATSSETIVYLHRARVNRAN
ncbi:MAG: hypothetical protein HRU23_09515 [Gammaproteobacteria bacterium]|nr:hypothetical protein [Gammaproteobacteria bacterium]